MQVSARFRLYVFVRQSFPHLPLEAHSNEVLLVHGTTQERAASIMQQGFDDRLGNRALYGSGVYFTTDACKADQYCGQTNPRVIILVRVLIGHAFIAEGPMSTHKRPPIADGYGVPHDSTIAHPGIPNVQSKGKGKGKGKTATQQHYEFVAPRGDLQAYLDLMITFTRA